MTKLYWIEIKRCVLGGKWKFYWQIKCRNGRVKANSETIYNKFCLCKNDATALGEEVGMEVR